MLLITIERPTDPAQSITEGLGEQQKMGGPPKPAPSFLFDAKGAPTALSSTVVHQMPICNPLNTN